MKRSILVTALIAAFVLAASAQGTLSKTDKIPSIDGSVGSDEYQYSGTAAGMNYKASLGSDGMLYLAIEAPTKGWVGLGVGGTVMNGSRLFLGALQDGKPAFIEKLGRGHFYVDAKDLVVKAWAVKSSGDKTTMELSLPSSAAVWKGQIGLTLAYATTPNLSSRHKVFSTASLKVE